MSLDQAIMLKLEAVNLLTDLLYRVSPGREYYGREYQLRASRLIPTALARSQRRDLAYLHLLVNRYADSQVNLSDG